MAAAALIVVVATAIAVPALTGSHARGRGPQPSATGSLPPSTRNYPGAVAARYQLSGVTAVVGDAGHAWVIRDIGQPGEASIYQLAGIDLRTNSIMFRVGLGRQLRAIASGNGRLWLTTRNGQAAGRSSASTSPPDRFSRPSTWRPAAATRSASAPDICLPAAR